MSRALVELSLAAERAAAEPLVAQITAQLRAAVTDGRLAAGERLPSTRVLAATLGVSRTVVTSAYAQLFAEGWIEGRHGSGTFVGTGVRGATARTPGVAGLAGATAATGAETMLADLRPGTPWTAGIDRAAWRRAWRQAGLARPVTTGSGAAAEAAGLPEVREAVAGYLRRSRGVLAPPGRIMLTGGVSASLALIAMALLAPGDRVGVEEPGYPAAREVFAAHGARLVPCRVDADGLITDELPDDLRLIYTTPAHQYPLGGRLPVPRRQRLTDWARATGALIVEDDYDGEFRYDVAPLPTLSGLDPEVVIYLGTTTKTLTPALGAGWLVARPELVAAIGEAARRTGTRVPEPVQRALLCLIAGGDLERHIRRMRHEYARRRAAMVSILGSGPGAAGDRPGPGAVQRPDPAGRLLGDTAGMHMVLELPPAMAGPVVSAARDRGVAVLTLDRYFTGPPSRHGLVLGYGAAALPEVTAACHILAEILAGVPGPA